MIISRLAWIVLSLALLSAVASLFGPAVQTWGLDLGGVGSAIFGVTLWGGVWLFAAQADRIFSPAWSISERRAWAGLIFVLLISLTYLQFMIGLAALEVVPTTLEDLPAQRFISNLVVLFIAWGVVSSTVGGKDAQLIEADERDLRLRRSADHVGDWAFTV